MNNIKKIMLNETTIKNLEAFENATELEREEFSDQFERLSEREKTSLKIALSVEYLGEGVSKLSHILSEIYWNGYTHVGDNIPGLLDNVLPYNIELVFGSDLLIEVDKDLKINGIKSKYLNNVELFDEPYFVYEVDKDTKRILEGWDGFNEIYEHYLEQPGKLTDFYMNMIKIARNLKFKGE